MSADRNDGSEPSEQPDERAAAHPIGEGTGDDAGRREDASGVKRRGTGPLAVAMSVGAGLLGVQSSKNRERDFTEGKAIHFIIGGLIGTLIFLLAIWLLVQYLIATS